MKTRTPQFDTGQHTRNQAISAGGGPMTLSHVSAAIAGAQMIATATPHAINATTS